MRTQAVGNVIVADQTHTKPDLHIVFHAMILGGTEHTHSDIALCSPAAVPAFIRGKNVIEVEQEISIQLIIFHILSIAVLGVHTLTLPILLNRVETFHPVVIIGIDTGRTAIPSLQTGTCEIQTDGEVRMEPFTNRDAESRFQTVTEREGGIFRPHEHTTGEIRLNIKVTPERRRITGFIIHLNSICS